MRKAEIAKRMARSAGVSEAEAADRLDRVVRQILENLRRGRPASLTPADRAIRFAISAFLMALPH